MAADGITIEEWIAPAFLVAFVIVGGGAWFGRSRKVSDRWDTVAADVCLSVPGASFSPASAGSVRRQLGLFEARELLRSGWFAAGVGMCLLALVAADRDSSLGSVSEDLLILAHPLVGMVIMASHRASTRAARDDTRELCDVCATDQRSRSIGVVWSAWAPAGALAIFFGAYVAVVVGWGETSVLANPGATTANLTAGLVLGVGGVALGAALGRWTEAALAPVVAVAAIGFASARLGDMSVGSFEPRMVLSTVGPVGGTETFSLHYTTMQATVHLAVMVLLTAVTIAIVATSTDSTGMGR